VRQLVAAGRYGSAVEVAKARVVAHPEDAYAKEDHRLASIALLMDSGRRLSFVGQDLEALAAFEQAQAMSSSPETDGPSASSDSGLGRTPDQPQQWIDKTRTKIAMGWLKEGTERMSVGDLVGAGEAFAQAEQYDPSVPGLDDEIENIDRRLAFRSELAEEYYNAGIGQLRSGNLEVAGSRFSYSDKYAHGEGRAQERLIEVRAEIARRHVASAMSLEAQGFFSAARVEYVTALDRDPSNEMARDGLARMRLEAEAFETLKEGEMWVLREGWEEAKEILLAGREKTQMQVAEFDRALLQLAQARTQQTYELAVNLEHDFRFSEAIVEYERILETQDFYLDVRTRLDTLQGAVDKVQSLYEAQSSETNSEERLKLLRQIEFIWPGYKDVQALLGADGS